MTGKENTIKLFVIDPDSISTPFFRICHTSTPKSGHRELFLCLQAIIDPFQEKSTNLFYHKNSEFQDDFFYKEIDLYPHIALGDIIIALETMQQEALEQNKPLPDHFAHLLVHGALHLLGFDHIKEEDALIMQKLEADILAKHNIPNPHAD